MAQARPDHDFLGELQKAPEGEIVASIQNLEAKESPTAVDRAILEALIAVRDATPEDSQSGPDLSPEQPPTFQTLKENFESRSEKLKPNFTWEQVVVKLAASPEKLQILARSIARGGEPTPAALLPSGNFRFDELSTESPIGKRNVDWYGAKKESDRLGMKLTEEVVYNSYRAKGIILDSKTSSWLDDNERNAKSVGRALSGHHGVALRGGETYKDQNYGLRCSVEV